MGVRPRGTPADARAGLGSSGERVRLWDVFGSSMARSTINHLQAKPLAPRLQPLAPHTPPPRLGHLRFLAVEGGKDTSAALGPAGEHMP